MATASIYARDLVEHKTVIDGVTPIRDFVQWLKENPKIDFVAVIHDGGLGGIVGRDQLNARLADKYGYAVLADKPISQIMDSEMLVVEGSMELHVISDLLLNSDRSGGEFYQDMIIQENGEFLGLASVRRLLSKQMKQILGQMTAIARQAEALTLKNQETVSLSMKMCSSEEEFDFFMTHCSLPLLALDMDCQLVRCNSVLLQMLGYGSDEVPSSADDRFFVESGVAGIRDEFVKQQGKYGEGQSIHWVTLKTRNDSQIGAQISFDIQSGSGEKLIVLAVLREVDKRELDLQMRLMKEAEGKSQLARNVVSSLIDRSSDTDLMVRKVETMVDVAAKLDEVAQRQASGQVQAGSFQGDISDFSVIDLAQLLVMSNKTGQAKIMNVDTLGFIYFNEGRIVHAECGELVGEKALARVVSVRHGTFSFTYDVIPKHVSISGEPTSVLMNCCSSADEGELGEETFPELTEADLSTQLIRKRDAVGA